MAEGAAFAALQRALPQHTLSRLLGALAKSERAWIKDPLIQAFARAYQVDLSEAEQSDPRSYPSFNAFFTRALVSDARTIDGDTMNIVSPADGAVSQAGNIENGTLLQAKGFRYDIGALAPATSARFEGGTFITVYLAPRDYHRVHTPLAGRLTQTTEVPGALFSVNAATEGQIEGLFCRNERLVCEFDTAIGPMLVVLVGALIVASIETVWAANPSPYRVEHTARHDQTFGKGDELGRFLLGSTVIVCLPPGTAILDGMVPGTPVKMGTPVARIA